MNYNKPTIPKGTCYFMNIRRCFVIENQLLTKYFRGHFIRFLHPNIRPYIGIFRYI